MDFATAISVIDTVASFRYAGDEELTKEVRLFIPDICQCLIRYFAGRDVIYPIKPGQWNEASPLEVPVGVDVVERKHRRSEYVEALDVALEHDEVHISRRPPFATTTTPAPEPLPRCEIVSPNGVRCRLVERHSGMCEDDNGNRWDSVL